MELALFIILMASLALVMGISLGHAEEANKEQAIVPVPIISEFEMPEVEPGYEFDESISKEA